MLIGTTVLATLSVGCSAHGAGTREPEPAAQELQFARGDIRLVSYDQPAPIVEKQQSAQSAKEVKDDEKSDARPQLRPKVGLPLAIEMCVNRNFRVLAGAEMTHMAEADLVSSSLIPNPTLLADYQLIPLQRADINNQLGPPQADVSVSVPIDWLLFGKRLAAIQAARLGIAVSDADAANVLRIQLAQTVDAFYEVLMDEAYFKLAQKNLDELTDLAKVTAELAKTRKVGDLEVDRIKLAVHEALLEMHDRELAVDTAKARLRPFLGRNATECDFEVEGALTVTAVVPPPKLEEALALAEAQRPDLLSGRTAIDQANAVVELERRRARPQVAIQPGWSYQNQQAIDGFRNGSLFEIGIAVSLPLTDRNQGNILRARAQEQERQFTYHGDRADALAEVEASVASYGDAVEHLTQFNTPETLTAAEDLRKNTVAAYRAGDRKLIELLDAQKSYHDRLAHVIEFESDYWRTLNRLNAAVGLKPCDLVKGPTQPVGKEAEKQP
jgi:outer membrane protein, heavy metal efflux system